MTTAQLRIVCPTKPEAEETIAYLRQALGSAVTLYPPRAGRKGGFLVYGSVVTVASAKPAPATRAINDERMDADVHMQLEQLRLDLMTVIAQHIQGFGSAGPVGDAVIRATLKLQELL